MSTSSRVEERQLTASRTVRVASVPEGHVYVRHLCPPADLAAGPDPGVVRLPDPTQPWWPPVLLDPGWISANSDSFDLMHVHFGFDALSPATLTEVVRSLRRAGKPLVLTVHDLRNPHHESRDLHDAQLDVLVPAAAALITLTRGAAAEIARRWARQAYVVPHPHVVDLVTLERRAAEQDDRVAHHGFLVGVHLKSLRACMSGPPVVDALSAITAARPDLRLRVDAHTDVATPSGARYSPELAQSLRRAERSGADVRVHDYFSDEQLWDYLSELDLSVLPYRFGTHSGWLEACRDLGTAVAAPRCGYYADQGAHVSFDLDENGLDVSSLAGAVHAAQQAGPPRPVAVADRVEQRLQIARVHAEIYRRVTP